MLSATQEFLTSVIVFGGKMTWFVYSSAGLKKKEKVKKKQVANFFTRFNYLYLNSEVLARNLTFILKISVAGINHRM